jgi:hypothetical protein
MVVLKEYETQNCPNKLQLLQWKGQGKGEDYVKKWRDKGEEDLGYYMIYLLIAIGLTPGGSSTVHIYTQTIHRTTQLTTLVGRLSGIRTQSGQTKINEELTA